MKKMFCLLVALSFVVILTPSQATTPDGSAAPGFVTDLIAGKHHDIGDVTVWNDADFLYVKYEVQYVWLRFVHTHLHVATSLDGIPTVNGNPVPGKFDYKVYHPRWVQAYTYTIPMDAAWKPGDELCIASHAVITASCGVYATVWGDGPGFPGANWGMYIPYKVQD